jgi:hypothetical protein
MVPGMSNRQRSPSKPRATVHKLPTFDTVNAKEAARTISGPPPLPASDHHSIRSAAVILSWQACWNLPGRSSAEAGQHSSSGLRGRYRRNY